MSPYLIGNLLVLALYVGLLLTERLDPLASLVTATAISLQIAGAEDPTHTRQILAAMAHPVLYLMAALALLNTHFIVSAESRLFSSFFLLR